VTVESEGSFLGSFCLLWRLKKEIRDGVPLKSVGGSCRGQKSKMAAVGHLENNWFGWHCSLIYGSWDFRDRGIHVSYQFYNLTEHRVTCLDSTQFQLGARSDATQSRDRLTWLVESTSALSDPFANHIMNHHACWQKYISHSQLRADDAMHFQDVFLSEARRLFFRHVDNVIFNEHEIRYYRRS